VDSSIVIQFLAVDSEERWICQSIFTFTDCPVSIHSFQRYFNYVTPLWSAV